MFSHDFEDYAMEPEKPKTYGRFLVRFFWKKWRFCMFLCSFFETARGSSTPSMICGAKKFASFI
jgi:hypothetical protein